MEEFRDIDDFYSVSNKGNIKSKRNNKILKSHNDSKNRGYKYITLNYNGIKKTRQVHRLVAQAFLPNPNNYPCINHKDENPSNNDVSNLEWCTYSYNLSYAGKIKREHKTKVLNKCINAPRKVIQKDKNGNIINEFNSAAEAGRKLNIASTHIIDCCNKKVFYNSKNESWVTRTAGGFIFCWKDTVSQDN